MTGDEAPEVPVVTMRAIGRRILKENLQVKRSENVTIESWSSTLPWANAAVLEAYRLQARPMLLTVDEPTYWSAVDELPGALPGKVGSHEWAALRETDAYVFFFGPRDAGREEALTSEKHAALTAYETEWFRIVEKSRVRTVRIDLGRMDAARARKLHLDWKAWQQESIDAILVDNRKMQNEGTRVGRSLERGRQVRITHPNGTRLDLRLRGRRARVHDGVVDRDDVRVGEVFEVLPSGWVAVAVDERYAEGEFIANVPSAYGAMGSDADSAEPTRGGHWTFAGGKLTDFSFESGGDSFGRIYRKLGAGKERPGSLHIGLNPKIRNLPTMEDQVRGRVTFVVGRNANLDGATHTPYFHGYVVLDGADVTIDGRLIVRAGEIV